MILEMNDIRKSFGGLEVLQGIDISVGKGETVLRVSTAQKNVFAELLLRVE